MISDLPIVAIFGALDIELKSHPNPHVYETNELCCRCYLTDENLDQILTRDRPDVLISLGSDAKQFPNLMATNFETRRRWLHFTEWSNLDEIGEVAYFAYMYDVTRPRIDAPPLVSIFTPTFNTGRRIDRVYSSLLTQTYSNWEWVLLDDSDDQGQTHNMLARMADKDHRIELYRSYRHSGVIGETKHQAASLCHGQILVELDHDDELMPTALEDIVATFQMHPEAGFVYSDWAEVSEHGVNSVYPDGWAFGYGSTYRQTYRDHTYIVNAAPHINPMTVRHIVSAPNHVRAWKADLYHQIGGHNKLLKVADDFELILRTFLSTRMVRIPKLEYIQYYNDSGNTQFRRNKDIQRAVGHLASQYDSRIHSRFLELGIDDFLWDKDLNRSNWDRPKPLTEQFVDQE